MVQPVVQGWHAVQDHIGLPGVEVVAVVRWQIAPCRQYRVHACSAARVNVTRVIAHIHQLRGRQVGGAKFRRQHPVGLYVADLACVEQRLIVELDGPSIQRDYLFDRVAEIARFEAKLDGLDDRQREAVEALTKGLVAKLLHQPTVTLKDTAGSATGERLADATRQLFDLDDPA